MSLPNLSLHTIPLAWILALAPHVYATNLYETSTSKPFDNRHPRTFIPKVTADPSLPTSTKNRILRGEGAHQNGFENLGFFAAAVLAGNYAGLSTAWLNGLSGLYVVSRAVYDVVYVANETVGLAHVRTGVFMTGVACCMGLFVGAGEALRKG